MSVPRNLGERITLLRSSRENKEVRLLNLAIWISGDIKILPQRLDKALAVLPDSAGVGADVLLVGTPAVLDFFCHR